jgi:ferredoxin
MSTVIYYFTGTGNSLMVAKKLSEKIENAHIVSIPKIMNQEKILIDDDCIGIVFPLYYQVVPVIVQDFIKRLQFKENTYVFGIVTCGAKVGISLTLLSELLKKQGTELASGFHMKLPYNYIINTIGLKPPKAYSMNRQLKKGDRQIDKISKIINKQQVIGIDRKPLIKHIHPYSYLKKEELEKNLNTCTNNFSVDEHCIGCSTCKSICPVGNIEMINNKPSWNKKCQQCLACINWCPQKAIEYGKVTQKQKRYTNPEISIKDMINSAGKPL